jgi:hypothetical protein
MTGLERVKELFEALSLHVQGAYLMPHIRLRMVRKAKENGKS